MKKFSIRKSTAVLLSGILLLGMLTACKKGDAAPPEEIQGPQGALSAIVEAIYENKSPELAVATTEIDIADTDALQYNTGLSGSEKIKEAAVSESMIGSQAYSLVLVRVNNSADTKEVVEAMKAGIDQRKWICVEADDLRVAACGDVIMLIMVSTALEDTVTAAQMVDAFQTVCGGSLTVDLK